MQPNISFDSFRVPWASQPSIQLEKKGKKKLQIPMRLKREKGAIGFKKVIACGTDD